jgi:hypothetical protein
MRVGAVAPVFRSRPWRDLFEIAFALELERESVEVAPERFHEPDQVGLLLFMSRHLSVGNACFCLCAYFGQIKTPDD